jgi:hypothetical protein
MKILWSSQIVHVYDVFLKYHEKIVIDQYISCSEWSCLDDKMMMYCQVLCKLEDNFDSLKYLHILWGWNEIVNELTKLGSSRVVVPPSVACRENSQVISRDYATCREHGWVTWSHGSALGLRTLFMIYLRTRGLPDDKDERKWLRHRAGHYTLINDEVFRQIANSTLMQCIFPDEGCAII